MNQIIKALFLSTLLIGCEKNSIEKSSVEDNEKSIALRTGSFYSYLISPSTTNSAIVSYNNNHYVCVDTRTILKNKLFVFFPGTSGSPENYKLLIQKAASLGYHAIGLMYPNGSDIYVASGSNPDNTQFGKCRQEKFDGTNQTYGVSVNSDNCIKNRLYKLLIYLQQQYPNLNFGQFIRGNEVAWDKCTLAGHSQGGGHAFYIAKKVGVEKTISFSSIDWNTLLGRSADWVSQASVTPISKFYSFNSTKDQLFSYSKVQIQLTNMGLSGTASSIDNTISPYSFTHRLITSATAAFLLPAPDHSITCLDGYVPKDLSGNVSPAFADAWSYLISN